MKRMIAISAVLAALSMCSAASAGETKKPSIVKKVVAKIKKALTRRTTVRTPTAVAAVRG